MLIIGWISVFYRVLLWCHMAQTSSFSPLNVCGTSSIPPHMYKNSYHIHSIVNTAMQSAFLTRTGILKYLQDLNAFTHVHMDKLYNISVMLYYSISFGMSCRPINTFMLELICSSMHFYNDTFSWSREIHQTYPYISKANKNICMNVSESYFDLQYHHSVNRDKQYSITAM